MEVSALYVYPVKSLRGISLAESAVGPKGLRFDRHWMVVDEEGKFRTQRQLAQMTRVSTSLEEGLVLSAVGCGSVAVPFEASGEVIEGTVWGWTGPVQVVDARVNAWLSEVLEMPCRLVTMASEAHRASKVGDGEVDFPDAMPVLVAGDASLAALNATLEEPVPMDRFRANVIVSGSGAYEEDEWAGMEINGLAFDYGRRCGRCVVTTTDQLTGERHPKEQPLRTLVRDRLFDRSACFGSYYLPRGNGTVRVGDPVLASIIAGT